MHTNVKKKKHLNISRSVVAKKGILMKVVEVGKVLLLLK